MFELTGATLGRLEEGTQDLRFGLRRLLGEQRTQTHREQGRV